MAWHIRGGGEETAGLLSIVRGRQKAGVSVARPGAFAASLQRGVGNYRRTPQEGIVAGARLELSFRSGE